MDKFRKALLGWYGRNARKDLPWRKTKDPYAIWVSEAMLQQTQVTTVIPYYERFLRRFPTVKALSRAPLTAILDSWSGLGYYSRAKNLHAGASMIVREYAGKLPSSPEDLRKIPGIGRYTAGAIASIAFDRPAPALDGNGIRVLARYLGIRDDPGQGPVQRKLWETLTKLVPAQAPGDFNQALMDLGATLCTPRDPRCPDCPIGLGCAAFSNGWQNEIPPPKVLPVRKKLRYVCALLEKGGAVLLARRPIATLLPGLWEFPGGEIRAGESTPDALQRRLQERLGVSAQPLERIGRLKQLLSHRELWIEAFRCRWRAGPLQCRWYTHLRWVPVEQLRRMAMTAGMEKLAQGIFSSSDAASGLRQAACGRRRKRKRCIRPQTGGWQAPRQW